MALQSQLFRGDSKLEAAAISDPAHVFLGANGQHVRKIQFALFLLDGSNIDQDGIYGPRTAAAVSAFKQKRQIINTQGKIDDIVGKKTIARLDLEMLAKEKGGVLPLPPLPKPPPRRPPAPKPQPPGQPTPVNPAPPAALETGSTNWRFSFFGNKGFTGAGIFTLSVSSTQ